MSSMRLVQSAGHREAERKYLGKLQYLSVLVTWEAPPPPFGPLYLRLGGPPAAAPLELHIETSS